MSELQFQHSDRFDGDFLLAATAEPSTAEREFIDALNGFVAVMAKDKVPSELEDEFFPVRRTYVQTLRQKAEEVAATSAGKARDEAATKARNACLRWEGAYRDRRDSIKRIPFVVNAAFWEDRPGQIENIKILTRDTYIPADKQKFKVEVDRSITVIRTVLLDRRSWWSSWRGRPDKKVEDAMRRLNEYLRALEGIAKVGLMNSHQTQTPFAFLALEGLQSEFVAREAGLVKNSYVMKLGFAALIASILAIIAYGISTLQGINSSCYKFRGFFLLCVGSSVGTWLSFSLRRVQLSFTDLATLEDDRLSPEFRVIFMVVLTMVIGLLLWTHAVVIEIGGFKSDFSNSGTFALLIGALCGIAERSIKTAVSKRAEDFVAGMGGSAPPGASSGS